MPTRTGPKKKILPDVPGVIDEFLGVAEDPLVAADPVAFAKALGKAGLSASARPLQLSSAVYRFALGVANATSASAAVALGREPAAPAKAAAKDRRFDDEAYRENPYFFFLQQLYLLNQNLVHEVLDIADLPEHESRKARFAAQFALDALSPSNMLFGNPAALRRAVQTGGKSVARGLKNFSHDVRYNGGWPSQVDASGFKVGENMATTPGKVVYRSDLIELIQYEPKGARVYEIPLLFCPPWINKYYIMDLAPGKSLIEWALDHGHTCFAISYRNPDESMRELTFEDYLFKGPLDALRVVREITGAPQVNMLSVCLGGTLTAIALAYNARIGDESIHSASFLNTHTDFSHPGVLGVFTDEETVEALEKRMAKKGYLEAKEMARTFDAIRANDLVFQYVANNWLMGEQPPAFDLLAWNNDSTRMPAKMHTSYLRSCYLNNEFSRGLFEVQGHRVDPRDVKVDTYVLSAIDDHIVPWQSGFKTTQLLGGSNRFVLSTAGHIAGIVNPPNPKAKHWTNDSDTTDPEEWKAGATLHNTTWWQDWIKWVSERAGEKVKARKVGSAEFPPLCDAPGTFVHIKA